MKALALPVGIVALLAGILGVAWPLEFIRFGYRINTSLGLCAIGVLRIVLGLILFLAAPGSRTPTTMRLLGGFLIVDGLVAPFIGIKHAKDILDWWIEKGASVIRLPFCLDILIGVFVICGFAGKERPVIPYKT